MFRFSAAANTRCAVGKPDQLAKLGITVRHHHRSAKAEQRQSRRQVGGEPIPRGQKFTYTVRGRSMQTPEEFGDIVVRAIRTGRLSG